MSQESLDREGVPLRLPAEVPSTPIARRPSRISQEQLAAAERARLYHAGKLRAYATPGVSNSTRAS